MRMKARVAPVRVRLSVSEKRYRENVFERLEWLESRCDDLEETNYAPKRFIRNLLRAVFGLAREAMPLAVVVAVIGMAKGWW